jgi:hypothetical protein
VNSVDALSRFIVNKGSLDFTTAYEPSLPGEGDGCTLSFATPAYHSWVSSGGQGVSDAVERLQTALTCRIEKYANHLDYVSNPAIEPAGSIYFGAAAHNQTTVLHFEVACPSHGIATDEDTWYPVLHVYACIVITSVLEPGATDPTEGLYLYKGCVEVASLASNQLGNSYIARVCLDEDAVEGSRVLKTWQPNRNSTLFSIPNLKAN